jgi:hypothetical protein
MALKNKYFTKKLVFFLLILTTIGLLSGCAFPPVDDVPSDPVINDPILDEPVIDDPIIDEPTQPTDPSEIEDPKDPIETKPAEPELQYLRAFYVSNSGDDSKDGLTPETAWRTIAKVNKQVLKPGDAVLFKRGDTWFRESLKVGYSGTAENRVIYSAYGEGARPVFDGIRDVPDWNNRDSWTSLGNNVWSIPLSGRQDRRVWIDGEEKERSRYDAVGLD